MAEAREARFPFSLNTGRLRDQWHGMSRTGTVGRLFGHVAEPAVQMNAQDMARRQLQDGDLVHLTSKRGSILLPARASAEIGLSQAFVAMHWGEEYLSGCSSTGTPLAGINALTSPAYCPTSKQPELKHTPVKILKAELPWSLLAMAWLPPDAALAAHQALKPLMAMFPFATCVPFSGNTPGEERSGILFRAAADFLDVLADSHGCTDCPAMLMPESKAAYAPSTTVSAGVARTMRLSSGRQEPQLVPHLSAPCSEASRSSGVPLQRPSSARIARSVTLKQVHTGWPRDCTATGARAPGDSSRRP